MFHKSIKIIPFLFTFCTFTQGSPDSLFKLFTSGLSHVIWQDLDINQLSNTNLTSECKQSLQETINGLAEGSRWSYEMIDAASKFPAGFLDGTLTSFGDYDQCLNIVSKSSNQDDVQDNFVGQQCQIKLSFVDQDQDSEIKDAMLKNIPIFDVFVANLGLCLPSTCNNQDVQILINQTLKNYPFKLNERIFCDTKDSSSLSSKLKNLTISQIIAGSALAITISLVLIATVIQLIMKDNKDQKSNFISNFSILENLKRLSSSKSNHGARYNMIDGMRFTLIFFSIAGHCLTCLETVPGWYLINNLHTVRSRFELFLAQPLMNEGGMNLTSLIGGFVIYWSLSEVIKARNFRYKLAIFERWLRYAPSLMAMVAIDILWPLSGNGPMFTQIADHLLDKCSRFYWMNLFFINNMKSAPENCTPHTFYSSIDLQLYAIGILVIYYLETRPKFGIAICLTLIFGGISTLFYMSSIYTLSPVLIDYDATVEKSVNYLNYVHFATYGHLPAYYIGILVAYTLKIEGFTKRFKPILRIGFFVSMIPATLVHFAPSLHNTFHLISQDMVPLYVVMIKLTYVFYFTMFIYESFDKFYLNSLKGRKESALKNLEVKTNLDENNNKKNVVVKVLSDFENFIKLIWIYYQSISDLVENIFSNLASSLLVQCLFKLSFSFYIINYTIIRYDFFTSRTLMDLSPNQAHGFSKRLIYTFSLTSVGALLFHIFFVAPFDQIRKSYKIQTDRSKVAKS